LKTLNDIKISIWLGSRLRDDFRGGIVTPILRNTIPRSAAGARRGIKWDSAEDEEMKANQTLTAFISFFTLLTMCYEVKYLLYYNIVLLIFKENLYD